MTEQIVSLAARKAYLRSENALTRARDLVRAERRAALGDDREGVCLRDAQRRTTTMKLYYTETLNPRKACAVARYLDAPVEYVHVDLGKGENRTPEFLALNPNGKVPVLETGKGSIWESNAIMCYLARTAGSDLWPDGDRQIEVMRWLSWDSQHFTRHAGTLYFEHIIKQAFGMGNADRAVVEEATGFFKRFGAVLDDHLSGRAYLLGDALTVADFAAAITLPYAEAARIPLAEFPAIERWHGRLSELPGWLEPFPVARAAA